MSKDLWRLPATELQRRFREGTLSPVEALACLPGTPGRGQPGDSMP